MFSRTMEDQLGASNSAVNAILDTSFPPVWDISTLYASPSDPAIEADMGLLELDASIFSDGRIPGDDPAALQRREEIAGGLRRLERYVELLEAEGCEAPELKARVRKFARSLHQRMLAFDLHLGQVPDNAPAAQERPWIVAKARRLASDGLGAQREMQARGLDDAAEWADRHAKNLAEIRAGQKDENLIQLRAGLASPDPSRRAAAADALGHGLAGRLDALAACLNSMVRRRCKAQRIRGLAHWLDASRREQGASSQLTEAIIPTVSEHAPTARSFYDLKRRALGLPVLYERDRLAPWPGLASRCSWPEACALVLESFGGVSKRLRAAARRVFESGRIHADPDAGGSAGPFCLPAGVRPEPFVRLRFRGAVEDVLTLAHETGHAVHHVLSHGQGPLQDTAAPIMAETAACLSEELVLRRLVDQGRPQAALHRLERTMTLVFRQTALLRFEERMYAIGAERGFGSADLDQAWAGAHRAVYGGGLRLHAAAAHDWALVPHFYFSPGYVAAYVLGRLAAADLAQRLLHRQSGLEDALIQVLSQGLGPGVDKQYRSLGLNPNPPSFLDAALTECRRLVQQATAACNPST